MVAINTALRMDLVPAPHNYARLLAKALEDVNENELDRQPQESEEEYEKNFDDAWDVDHEEQDYDDEDLDNDTPPRPVDDDDDDFEDVDEDNDSPPSDDDDDWED